MSTDTNENEILNKIRACDETGFGKTLCFDEAVTAMGLTDDALNTLIAEHKVLCLSDESGPILPLIQFEVVPVGTTHRAVVRSGMYEVLSVLGGEWHAVHFFHKEPHKKTRLRALLQDDLDVIRAGLRSDGH